MTLLDLPAEILLRVFQVACLDDGRTGRALSAVSRRIREISAEYRYQSLAVDVLRCRTTRLLLKTLPATPASLRKVRHLYINRGQLFSPQWDPWFGIDLPTRYKKEKETGRDLREIIRLAAPHPQTFMLIFHVGIKDSLEKGDLKLEDVQMPHLRELTIDCPSEQLCRLPPTFAPSLRRLCIPSRLLIPEFGHSLATTFPHLSHLLISPLRYLSSDQWRTLRILMYTMRLHSNHYTHGPDVSQLAVMSSRSRRYISVQPYLSSTAKAAEDPRQITLMDCLKNCTARAHRFVVLTKHYEEGDDTIATGNAIAEAWKANWLESVQGKRGLWAYRNVSARSSVRSSSPN